MPKLDEAARAAEAAKAAAKTAAPKGKNPTVKKAAGTRGRLKFCTCGKCAECTQRAAVTGAEVTKDIGRAVEESTAFSLSSSQGIDPFDPDGKMDEHLSMIDLDGAIVVGAASAALAASVAKNARDCHARTQSLLLEAQSLAESARQCAIEATKFALLAKRARDDVDAGTGISSGKAAKK
jgi:hypothetical protein